MSSFTDDFFSNLNTKSTSTKSTTTSTKKKKKEYDVNNFTESFFSDSDNSTTTKSSSSTGNDFYDEYNAFIDELNGTRQEYYTMLQKNEEKRQQEIAKRNSGQAEAYYESNKGELKKQRSENLIYNWNWQDAGGTSYNYGSVPIQNEKGYLKKTDSEGNVYWVDAKEDLLYDANGNLINDDRLKDANFINSLKYEYDANSKSIINTSALKRGDRVGVSTIDYDKYKFLIDNENNNIENNRKKWEQEYQKKNEFFSKNQPQIKTPDYNMVNNHKAEGWIIKDGNYYKPIENSAQPPSDDFVGPMPKTEGRLYSLPTDIRVDGKDYELVTDEKPRSYIDSTQFKNPYDNYRNVYEVNFEKLNKAIEDGNVTTANNALQEINKKYFGHQYEDGWWAAVWNKNSDDWSFFQNRFEQNVEKLNVINDSLNNTQDADTINALNEEKNKLELENTLIQYNRLYAYHSDMNLIDKMDSITKPVDEAWDKVGQLWSKTLDEFDDGYDFGDIFKTAKHTLNNSIQTIGVLGKQTNAGIKGIETLAFSDMDDGEFKDVWLPAITDVATYMIPYVGQARKWINYAEPGSVIVAGVTREGSATIDSADGTPRVPDAKNIFGAAVNIAANYASDYIFSKVRSQFSPETIKQFYQQSGKAIGLTILKEAGGEALEELIQTYAEAMQNMEGDLSWDFFKEHTNEALKSALIAFVTAGGASTVSIGIGTMRGTGTVETNGDAVDNIRINRDIKENSNTTLFNVSNTKTFENLDYQSTKVDKVDLQVDEDASIEIANELRNDNIVTILDSDAIKTKSTQEVNLNNASDTTSLSDIVINDNIKTVLVPSKEIETYIKNLRDDLTVYTIDPKSDTFMDDVKEYVSDVGKSNIVTKNVGDFTPNNYTFTPNEMTTINQMVNEYINKGNLLDTINKSDTYKLNPITTSDITDSDINTIMNSIKTKFLNEITNNNISKETARKEYAELSKKLSEYAQKTKQTRTYIKDDKNAIITFAKRGSNIYEAVNTMPKRDADLTTFANVKTNGNIINGNLNQKVNFAKKQLNAVNTLIDKLGLKGNYLTPDSTYKDVASLVKSNLEFSKDILQALGADGLIEGKNKVRLYSAFDDLDNANPKGAIQNTLKELKSSEFKKELTVEAKTTAPSESKLPIKESTVSIEEKPIDVDKYAKNPENPSELNNIELEKIIDDTFKNITIKDKVAKYSLEETKDWIINAVTDGYSHIVDIATTNEDYNVRKAVYDLQAVASDAQTMISGAQMMNGEIVGKSLKQIYSDNKIKSKKEKQLFEKTMLHALNAEREQAGTDKIFENVSAKQSNAIVNKMFAKHPNFKEAANDLQRYNNNLLDMLVDGGVITEQLSTKLKNRYKYYMPIYSSDLTTFANLDSEKYFKNMKLDDTIKDATKTGKSILSLEKSMENKTYNVISAIAKNKLANEISTSSNYEGDSDLVFYTDGKINKIKVTDKILRDINDNSASHIADKIHSILGVGQLIDLSNLSYKFILDPFYQIKNVIIDFKDSAMIYSKDKKHFIPNYIKAVQAVSNNSELFHKCLENGLANIGEDWKAPKITYDENGKATTKQNKFQRIFANLEAMPKIAEYISLQEKYSKQAKKDYEAGKYNNSSKYAYTDDNGEVVTFYRYHKDAKNITDNYNYNDSNVSHHTGYGIALMNNDTYIKGKSDNDIIKTTISSKNGFLTNTDDFLSKEQVDNLNKVFNKYIPDITMFGKDVTQSQAIDVINQASEMIANANDNNTGKKAWDEFYNSLNKDGYVMTNKDGSKTAVVKSTKQLDFLNNNTPSLQNIMDNIETKAMLDASDVNLNFNRGGKVTKALSKSGFKFLNAGIQGFDKFVTHVEQGVKTPAGMGSLLLEFTTVGIGTAVANRLINGDDEDYDKLPYYYKNNYYMIKVGDNQFFRIPKGRVQSLYNVLFEYSSGLRKEDNPQDYIESLKSAFDSAVLPPALEGASPIGVYKQLLENKDAFGNAIYNEEYDSSEQKIQKSIYHLLSNYFGRYGRIVKDVTDGDSTTDFFNEFDFYKDTTKANRHYNTALDLVTYYQNKDNVKTLDDKMMKKYIDTQNYALRTINSEINQGKKSGQTTKDLAPKYAARDDLLKSMINNYKNYEVSDEGNGVIRYYFDEHCFEYNPKTDRITKKY